MYYISFIIYDYIVIYNFFLQEVRVSGFLADLEKGRRGAALLLSKMPHVIPHSERVVLFRKHIADEKAVMGLTESACNSPPTTLIVVHRSIVMSLPILQYLFIFLKHIKI